MSLKARLLLSVGLIAFLLVIAAVAVERTTSSYLNGKLDEQLALLARMRNQLTHNMRGAY